MLRVVCIRWGDKYGPEYVLRLQAMVERHLSVPHVFQCFTDDPVAGVECLPLPCVHPGWWQKVGLFRPGVITGPTIYLDLDSVLVANVDWLVPFTRHDLSAFENWGSRPREGPLYENELSSAVLCTNGSSATEIIWERFTAAEIDRLHPHGDQTWITEQFVERVIHIPLPWVLSYKRHCRQGLPPEASLVCFHGRPMPHEALDPWVLEHWRE